MSEWRIRVAGPLRAGDWWDHKLIPALAVFCGTGFQLRASLSDLAPAALSLLVALAAAAAFVSVLNDLADRDDDAAAGKINHMAGRTRRDSSLLLALPLIVGTAFLFVWRGNLPLVLVYAGSWIAFVLYSLPPFRLKERGFAGVACDAAGAHLFPALLAALLASAGTGASTSPWWTASVGLWAFAYGLRGILWHQLRDRENDRRAGVDTFAGRLSPERTKRLAAFLVFPIELAGLAAMLATLESTLPVIALIMDVLILTARARLTGVRPIIVAPAVHPAVVLQDYYELFLPLSILVASALAHPRDWLLLVAFPLVFPGRPARALVRISVLARTGRHHIAGTA